jgi:hypothetical protein
MFLTLREESRLRVFENRVNLHNALWKGKVSALEKN